MTKKGSVRVRDEFLNFLRGDLVESAAATFTQEEIDTNLSAERGVMMEIHSVEFQLKNLVNFDEVAAGGVEWVHVQLTRDSKTAVADISDADVIAAERRIVVRSPAIGTDAGPLWFVSDEIVRFDFALPIPYVKPSIFFGLQASDATLTHRVHYRIGYTLRDISREEFLELLVALQ